MPYSHAPQLTAPEPSAGGADIRLVVTDMDGTLLDDDKRTPDGLWEVLALLRERGVLFSPASGRQYATLVSSRADPLTREPLLTSCPRHGPPSAIVPPDDHRCPR